MTTATAIPSPCIGICTLDETGTTCTGCARTLDEIARWRTMDATERAAIVAALPARRQHRPD